MSSTSAPRLALLGNPNCGKTALFNLLTGTRQKVANYAGVTVERKAGWITTPQGRQAQVLDLPGTYSLVPLSHDETITHDVVTGRQAGEARPDLLVCVVDATHLQLNLRLVLEAQALGLPMVLVLNMFDVAQAQGLSIDTARLSAALGMPVVTAISVRKDGALALLAQLDALLSSGLPPAQPARDADIPGPDALNARVRTILADAVQTDASRWAFTDRVDRWVLHPLWGMVLLVGVLLFMFQAVFAWAALPMDAIEAGVGWLGEQVAVRMADGPLRSLLVDGVIAGVGGVLVFLPQILILFFFIFLLEDSGYLPRAAFLMDRLMGTVGLSGRSFIPLLSSFACAVPGIMATRTISHWRDRWLTILIAPLMTCSARLPVYALLIAAFIPDRSVAGLFNLQGLVLFALYLAGILSAMAVAFIVSRRGQAQGRQTPLLMELPAYRFPSARNIARGLWERGWIFVRRVGGIILALMVLLWFLSSYPAPPDGFTGNAIEMSLAGRLGHLLAPLFAPLGFDWRIVVALIPAMAAREVVVAALGTVYALSATGDEVAGALGAVVADQWSLATALSLLVWFVYAPQCIATLAAVRREAGGWKSTAIVTAYLFALAYAAAWITYRITLLWSGS